MYLKMDNILKYFIKEPEREFHVRELAKLANISPTTISKRLKKLKRNGFLTSYKKYNHLLFKASNNQKFKDAKLFNNIHAIRESGLIETLKEKFNNPEAIISFGSYAKAENISSSDIDIVIVTPLKKEIDLTEFEKYLNHKIHLFMLSNKEVENMKINNKELLNNIVNGIIIDGYWELFK